jgi:hypothetical protein
MGERRLAGFEVIKAAVVILVAIWRGRHDDHLRPRDRNPLEGPTAAEALDALAPQQPPQGVPGLLSSLAKSAGKARTGRPRSWCRWEISSLPEQKNRNGRGEFTRYG